MSENTGKHALFQDKGHPELGIDASQWHLASESGTVDCHNKTKKSTWQVNIKQVVALATSLQRITKTTLA